MSRTPYRSIGTDGDAWPQWVRDLKGVSGVYAIKEHGVGGEVVYVGSSKDRLYDTITRHFQQWKRRKQWWKGLRGEGHDPGMTYARGKHCVAIQVAPTDKALILESDWIARYKPRDNLTQRPDGSEPEPAPF